MRTWRNWQTRKIQVLMVERLCRFKSCCPHHTIATDFFIRCFFVRNRTLTCTTTASSCAVHAHASRHFRASPSPIGVRCKASPVVRTIATDFFIRCFFVRNRTLTCSTTASSCAVHAHASRHFRASPSPIGVHCKASPVVRTTDGRLAFSAKNMRLFHDLVFL